MQSGGGIDACTGILGLDGLDGIFSSRWMLVTKGIFRDGCCSQRGFSEKDAVCKENFLGTDAFREELMGESGTECFS